MNIRVCQQFDCRSNFLDKGLSAREPENLGVSGSTSARRVGFACGIGDWFNTHLQSEVWLLEAAHRKEKPLDPQV